MAATKTTKVFYAQRHPVTNLFYEGYEDEQYVYSQDPMRAIKKDKPWKDGDGETDFVCVKLTVETTINARHGVPYIFREEAGRANERAIMSYATCPTCGRHTKGHATDDAAFKDYKQTLANLKCKVVEFETERVDE